jgi:hypothetical protein
MRSARGEAVRCGNSGDVVTLVLTTFLFGLVTPAIPMGVPERCGIRFAGRHLGIPGTQFTTNYVAKKLANKD